MPLPVVPLYDVRLDDVLNRKHLPPLGLKDFEVSPFLSARPTALIFVQEWLLFVELSPENLSVVILSLSLSLSTVVLTLT